MGHHAYVYEGPLKLLENLSHDARERFGFAQFQNPDVHIRGFEKFGIDESRALVSLSSLRSATGRALYIIGFASATSEAQQALLKLLEEPQDGSVYVLLVPHGTLISTIRSRTAEYPEKLEHAVSIAAAKKFLASAYKERSAQITAMLKEDEGVREDVREFLSGLEQLLMKHMHTSKEIRQGLEDIAKVRSYIGDRAPSLKMLLEHLAVTLPTV